MSQAQMSAYAPRHPKRGDGVYASVRRYANHPELADTLAARAQEIRELISGISGFNGYYLIRSGNDTVSISVFEDESGANESNQVAKSWIAENLPDLALDPPEIFAGEVLISG